MPPALSTSLRHLLVGLAPIRTRSMASTLIAFRFYPRCVGLTSREANTIQAKDPTADVSNYHLR
eukprot:3320996-Pyramimonas_sp.AAC.1